jgi:DNA-binding phage protein
MATADSYEAERSLRMLYKAVSDSDGNPIAKTIERFRDLLSVNEKNILVDEYMTFENDCSPGMSALTEDEADAFLADLKKNPATAMNVSSIRIARQLIISSVNRLVTSQQANGSTSI